VNQTETKQAPELRNISAEVSLLGSLIVYPEALDKVTEHISADDFSNPTNGAIYSAICMAAIDDTTGLAAIVEQLRKDNTLVDVSEKYLHDLTKNPCPVEDLKKIVTIITDLSNKRSKISAARKVAQAVVNGEDETLAFDRLLDIQNRQVTIGDGFASLEDTMKNIISGNYKRTEPTILRRSDGHHLLYAGKLNWLSAPPEALKSFTALLATVQLLQEGKGAVYIDFEDDATTICERLFKVAVGQQLENAEELVLTWVAGPLYADGSRDHSKALFSYIAMGKAFDMKTRALVLKAIKHGAQLVTLDGCATAIALANLNENDNADVNKWINAVSYPFTSAGAAVVVIDHVVKSQLGGAGSFAGRSPRGAGSKLAAVSGAALSFEVKEAGSVYAQGQIELTVTKDRPGTIRCSKRSGRRIAGTLISNPIMGGNREGVSLVIHAADEMSKLMEEKRFDLVAAEHISKIVREIGPVSKTEIRKVLKERADAKNTNGFRTETTVAAFKFLEDNKYIVIDIDGKKETLTSLMEYKANYGDTHADDVDVNPFI